ncbi:radical SAM/SPASM protein FxsB, inactivated metallohydrolase extension form [Streptomyces sp. NPDC127106]|uniref:radical SAM/SPASM protein FxsBH, inactivated beta-hydroxylase extension form n=1 Tax=Streptomyces sp. NPDC127106 TaxID=3345360 RepID=UPI003638F6FE
MVKVHSRCDLACDHCYVYEHADQSWRARPAVMPEAVMERTAERVAEHARAHRLPSVTVILHGGEPLLAGPARLRRLCAALVHGLGSATALDLRIHTNGVRLDESFLDLFAEYGVKVGVSLDGDRTANDRHRRFANGRSSHPLVARALGLLRQDRHRHLYQGLLCTVDLANDPVAVLDALASFEPPRIDLLLPHATWDVPPPRPFRSGGAEDPLADGAFGDDAYGRWLLRAFDHWEARGRPVPVRLFDSLLSTLRGGPALTESLGLAPADLVVVETDGTLEQADSLKTAYEGAAATGFDVRVHRFDEVAAHPGIRARQLGLAGLGTQCRRCPVVRSCGGGLYAHRFRSGSGFTNPSVYCADLRTLVAGVEARTVRETTAPEVRDPAVRAASQRDLTRLLLARLHAELSRGPAAAGPQGRDWQHGWALVEAVEEAAPDALDAVLGHPYTRTWLLAELRQARRARPRAGRASRRLSALVAAAVVRGRLELPVRLVHRGGGGLYLPALGMLLAGAADGDGPGELRATADGFTVSGCPGGPVRTAVEDPRWQPVRTWRPGGADGARAVALDDLDPDRDCHGRQPRPRLEPAEAAAWLRRLDAARELLHHTVADLVAEAVLTTLTPLAGARAPAGRTAGRPERGCGPGALGLPLAGGVRETALALLTGWRRARLRELTEVADLYAFDEQWLHPSPWQGRPVPVSRLLAETDGQLALAAFRRAQARAGEGRERAAAGERAARKREETRIGQALDALGRAAELTVSGKVVVGRLRAEWELLLAD